MFHSQAMEHRINRIHKRTLKLIYPNQHQLTFKELLEKNKTISIATEIYKPLQLIFIRLKKDFS